MGHNKEWQEVTRFSDNSFSIYNTEQTYLFCIIPWSLIYLLLHKILSTSDTTEKCDMDILTWNCLLIGGCGTSICCNIICFPTSITPANPWTDMIQWHLLNEWRAIFAKVPPLKYLKLITSYITFNLETFEDQGTNGKTTLNQMSSRFWHISLSHAVTISYYTVMNRVTAE
jgi:hypothetical protein